MLSPLTKPSSVKDLFSKGLTKVPFLLIREYSMQSPCSLRTGSSSSETIYPELIISCIISRLEQELKSIQSHSQQEPSNNDMDIFDIKITV